MMGDHRVPTSIAQRAYNDSSLPVAAFYTHAEEGGGKEQTGERRRKNKEKETTSKRAAEMRIKREREGGRGKRFIQEDVEKYNR